MMCENVVSLAVPENRNRIVRALRWLKSHNSLYQDFYSNYETMLRFSENPSGVDRAVKVRHIFECALYRQYSLNIQPHLVSNGIPFITSGIRQHYLQASGREPQFIVRGRGRR